MPQNRKNYRCEYFRRFKMRKLEDRENTMECVQILPVDGFWGSGPRPQSKLKVYLRSWRDMGGWRTGIFSFPTKLTAWLLIFVWWGFKKQWKFLEFTDMDSIPSCGITLLARDPRPFHCGSFVPRLGFRWPWRISRYWRMQRSFLDPLSSIHESLELGFFFSMDIHVPS